MNSNSKEKISEAGPAKINLLGYDLAHMKAFFTEIGEKPFRAVQVLKWIHQFGVDDFSQMSNVSQALRARLADIAEIKAPEIIMEQKASDGTIKWLMRLDGGNSIETVFIPEDNRGTLCVSSQVGCALDCGFCSTARQGFNRNLSSAEIIAQLWIANRTLNQLEVHNEAVSSEQAVPKKAQDSKRRVITNVVLMGMGEPLLNFDNVVEAIHLMLEDHAYGLSKRRVTISTAGVVPALKRLREECDVSLAISLHAPNDKIRDRIVPLNKKYPIKELLEACRYYFSGDTKKKQFTIEYVMLAGINDSENNARELAALLKNLPCKINLIPFNPFPNSEFDCSKIQMINRFKDILYKAGYVAVVRKTRGEDIDAACGQLAGKVKDKSRRVNVKAQH
ncbi:MAG: 23S rRNA (adenine(2503)-C(2))-methyltransferase RlmN [gamma proteobacterium symbiont of Bathyaustriella thionipta]|nr:23S rRNA (adenine(2503)-C(2))-methyltransferase RlmN [gamma proteobacterium symbiont of Bathyaustriella thionipta]MCU7949073.1 23S rRNA (adenine(2503)-C(2))-methyltransferase RlmN [gamma proteobacterium symbiont of Bathyaustriella thionipta]MCU7952779.1 23S rRNA (adenine(2503)-C(2))-methyltransferase RlmN [gamma proteobacterium symbiont of Bathyaustriella thionipta]MCU7955724.1 23S rRNA (adenine(2503)-C(2))-methyltransferase RlmN [gamma proteobacterium symbiont of Bathyaustriella thionipta]M